MFGLYPQLTGESRGITQATDNKLSTGVIATGPSTFEPAPRAQPLAAASPTSMNRMDATTDPRSFMFGAPGVSPIPDTGVAPAAAVATDVQRGGNTGSLRDFSKELSTVPRDLPAGLQEGVIYKTKGANGETVYSGQNVKDGAGMVNGQGNSLKMGGSVTTLPAGATPGNAGLDGQVAAARMAAAQRGDFAAVAQSYGQEGFNGVKPDLPGSAESLRKQANAYAQTPGWSRSRYQAMMNSAERADAAQATKYASDNTLRGNIYEADQRAATAKGANMRADRSFALDEKRFALEQDKSAQSQRESADKALDSKLESFYTTTGSDGKAVTDRNAIGETKQAVTAHIGTLAAAARAKGDEKTANELEKQGPNALGAEGLQRLLTQLEVRRRTAASNSNFNPFGGKYVESANPSDFDVVGTDKGLLQDQYRLRNGSRVPARQLDYSGGGNAILPNGLDVRTQRFDMVKDRSLRNQN